MFFGRAESWRNLTAIHAAVHPEAELQSIQMPGAGLRHLGALPLQGSELVEMRELFSTVGDLYVSESDSRTQAGE